MLFWNNVHIQISILIHEIDEKKNEIAPDWFKIEEYSTVLSNKFNSKHWQTSEMFEISLIEVYLLLFQIFHLYLII